MLGNRQHYNENYHVTYRATKIIYETRIYNLQAKLFDLVKTKVEKEKNIEFKDAVEKINAHISKIKREISKNQKTLLKMNEKYNRQILSNKSGSSTPWGSPISLDGASIDKEFLEENKSYCIPVVKKILAIAPLFGTIASTAELADGVMNITNGGRKLFDKIYLSSHMKHALMYAVPATYFIQMASMNWRITMQNIDETVDILAKRTIPDETEKQRDEWPELTHRNEIYSLLVSTPFILFPFASDTIAAYFFIDNYRNMYRINNISSQSWSALSATFATLASIQTILCEGVKIHKISENCLLKLSSRKMMSWGNGCTSAMDWATL